jgi:hypothetical protein
MRARSFSDNPDPAAEDAKSDPEYAFDGFNVEFSVKIALTPAALAKKADGKRQDAR